MSVWKLIGIPADELVAGIGIDGAERVSSDGDFHFVHHAVTGESGVIGLEIKFELSHQSMFAEKIQASGGIGIVLMRCGFHGFGFDVELACEPDFLFVIHRHFQQSRQVTQFALDVSVPQCRISFASTPESVTFAAKTVGDFDCFFHLGSGVGKYICKG